MVALGRDSGIADVQPGGFGTILDMSVRRAGRRVREPLEAASLCLASPQAIREIRGDLCVPIPRLL